MAAKQRAQFGKARLDQPGHFHRAGFVDGDLDPRLILVIAPTERVVDRQDGLDIGQQVGDGQEIADRDANHRGAAQTATDHHFEPRLSGSIAVHPQADVMGAGHGAVIGTAGDGDLELAGQELEFRVVGGPLAQKLGIGAWIFDLIRCGTGKMIGGDVAHAVAGGLDGVHFHIRQSGQNGGHVGQFRPIELDVLPGGEMAIALVPGIGNQRQLAHLPGGEGAIGDGDPQHVGMQL